MTFFKILYFLNGTFKSIRFCNVVLLVSMSIVIDNYTSPYHFNIVSKYQHVESLFIDLFFLLQNRLVQFHVPIGDL